MNLAACPSHPDRKQEMVCLSDECPNRFELRCVQCIMASKCRQAHNWKIINEAIEEIYEVCQSTEVKEQKKGKQKKPLSQTTLDHQKQIESIVREFKGKISQLQQQINERVDAKAKRLFSKLNAGVESYTVVKNILKLCKKDTQPGELSERLKEVSHYIKCSPDGTLGLIQPAEAEQLEDTDLSILQSELNQLLDNLSYIVDEENEMPSQMEGLKKNYQLQIDKLLEQVKQIPVLQNRIQSLNEKLQAKDARLKKYESGGPQPKAQQKGQDSMKRQEGDGFEKVKRIQTLIDRRQNLRKSLMQYIQKSPQQEVLIYQLKPQQTIEHLQVPVATQTSYLLNQCMLSIADELQFHKYSDSTTGEQFIEVPLVSIKKEKQRQQAQHPRRKQYATGNNFLDSLFGL